MSGGLGVQSTARPGRPPESGEIVSYGNTEQPGDSHKGSAGGWSRWPWALGPGRKQGRRENASEQHKDSRADKLFPPTC
jgi:hypothetical protein